MKLDPQLAQTLGRGLGEKLVRIRMSSQCRVEVPDDIQAIRCVQEQQECSRTSVTVGIVQKSVCTLRTSPAIGVTELVGHIIGNAFPPTHALIADPSIP